jgi:hypothetical protein
VLPLLPSEPCSLLVRNCLPPNRLLTMTLTSEAADAGVTVPTTAPTSAPTTEPTTAATQEVAVA